MSRLWKQKEKIGVEDLVLICFSLTGYTKIGHGEEKEENTYWEAVTIEL